MNEQQLLAELNLLLQQIPDRVQSNSPENISSSDMRDTLLRTINAIKNLLNLNSTNLSQNNKFKTMKVPGIIQQQSLNLHQDIANYINNVPYGFLPEVEADEIPVMYCSVELLSGFVEFQQWLIIGYGAGLYGQSGTITLSNSNLVLMEKSTISSPEEDGATVENLGTIANGTNFWDVINGTDPNYGSESGTPLYFTFTQGDYDYTYLYTGPNGHIETSTENDYLLVDSTNPATQEYATTAYVQDLFNSDKIKIEDYGPFTYRPRPTNATGLLQENDIAADGWLDDDTYHAQLIFKGTVSGTGIDINSSVADDWAPVDPIDFSNS